MLKGILLCSLGKGLLGAKHRNCHFSCEAMPPSSGHRLKLQAPPSKVLIVAELSGIATPTCLGGDEKIK